MSLTQTQITALSTHGSKLLLRAENMETFVTSYGDSWVDPLSPRIVDLLDKVKKDLQPYNYTGGKPLTTVSYELYNTTSAWWIILYVNGYMHPDEISDGAILKVPSGESIQVLLRESAKNNRGKVVTL